MPIPGLPVIKANDMVAGALPASGGAVGAALHLRLQRIVGTGDGVKTPAACAYADTRTGPGPAQSVQITFEPNTSAAGFAQEKNARALFQNADASITVSGADDAFGYPQAGDYHIVAARKGTLAITRQATATVRDEQAYVTQLLADNPPS